MQITMAQYSLSLKHICAICRGLIPQGFFKMFIVIIVFYMVSDLKVTQLTSLYPPTWIKIRMKAMIVKTEVVIMAMA